MDGIGFDALAERTAALVVPGIPVMPGDPAMPGNPVVPGIPSDRTEAPAP